MTDDPPVVLIVDDEGVVADVYAELLGDEYDCRVAYSGREALKKYGPDIDVVLLDRRMPDIAGDEVLAKIRRLDGESRVAMVTAVQPDFDVIDMGFDDYLVKPISQDDLHRTVRDLLELSKYSTDVQRYFSLVTKRAWLETEKSVHQLESSDEYQQLCTDITDLEAKLDETVDDFSAVDYEHAFKDIVSGQPT